MKITIFIFMVLILAAISFAGTAGIIYVLSLCFNFAFSWKLAIGIWFVLLLARSIFDRGK